MKYCAWKISISLMMTAFVLLPAVASAQGGGDMSLTLSQPTIYIGGNLTISAHYDPPAGEKLTTFNITVTIYEIQIRSDVWHVNGKMSARGNFSCVFWTNSSTDFGYYIASAKVENTSTSLKFGVNPSNLDIWQEQQNDKVRDQARDDKMDFVWNYYLPISVLIALAAGGYVAFKDRVGNGKLTDIWDFIFAFIRERKIKSMFSDFRDPDRLKYRRHHEQPIIKKSLDALDLHNNLKRANALYERKIALADRRESDSNYYSKIGREKMAHKRKRRSEKLREWAGDWKKSVIDMIETELVAKKVEITDTKKKLVSDSKRGSKRIIESENLQDAVPGVKK